MKKEGHKAHMEIKKFKQKLGRKFRGENIPWKHSTVLSGSKRK
jgi:hypothetical protein